jgi:transcriptional regulator with XRE-family HTH domain
MSSAPTVAMLGGHDPRALLGRNARAARKEAHLSQSQVAAKSAIHSTEVSRIERGLRDPRLSTIIRLARAVGVQPAQLLDGIEVWLPPSPAAAMAAAMAAVHRPLVEKEPPAPAP